MSIEDIANLLADKINQKHYIVFWLNKIKNEAYKKGFSDAEKKKED